MILLEGDNMNDITSRINGPEIGRSRAMGGKKKWPKVKRKKVKHPPTDFEIALRERVKELTAELYEVSAGRDLLLEALREIAEYEIDASVEDMIGAANVMQAMADKALKEVECDESTSVS
jgi:hypothetical protein